MALREDECRTYTGHAAGKRSLLRRLAGNLLKDETSRCVGIYPKRPEVDWDYSYHLKILQA